MKTELFRRVVKRASDLVTPRSKTIEGFVEQARQKIEKAGPVVEQAKDIQRKLTALDAPESLLADPVLRSAILFSAGLSNKAQGHLSEDELDSIARAAIAQFRHESEHIGTEILFRYLLTIGDSLGGSMRNVTGASAQHLIAKNVMDELNTLRIPHEKMLSKKDKVVSILWSNRILLFDRKPKFIDNNIDMILLSGKSGDLLPKGLIESKSNYIAVGELKGGIDPAGADEHWKTARSALDRVRKAFSRASKPCLFFAGASIEMAMAEEIYADVQKGKLDFAANLSMEEQTGALIKWLVSL